MTNALECHDISKSFDGVPVVQHVDLTVAPGAFVTLLGPSGCGKTTTLRLIAGFERPETGGIVINGRTVADERTDVPPEERRVGMVFQDYALFPHLSVAENIAFGLNGPSGEKQTRVDDLLALVGLEAYSQRMPYELSGGQQQRVALARAMAPNPAIILLDEPFSNLDTALREQVRAEVRDILRRAGTSVVFVTHDQEEALSLSDEVAVMFDGHVVQTDAPQRLYHHPVNRQVATFVGEANFLPAEAEGNTARCVLGEVSLVEGAFGPVDVMVRPEQLSLTHGEGLNGAAVLWREFFGHDQRVGVELADGTRLVAREQGGRVYRRGQRVHVRVAERVQAFER